MTPATADHGVHRRHAQPGHAVESTCTLLTKHGCKVAARTYRSWRQAHRSVAARTASGAVVIDALLATVATPEGLYERRKMTAHLRRSGLEVAYRTVDRLMRDQGMNGGPTQQEAAHHHPWQRREPGR